MALDPESLPGWHDYIPDADIIAEQEHSRQFVEASIKGQIMEAQVAALAILREHHALGPYNGWAVFDLSESEVSSGSTLSPVNQKAMLVIARRLPLSKKVITTHCLRLVSSEFIFPDPELANARSSPAPQILSCDVELGPFGMVRYHTAAYQTEFEDPDKPQESSAAVFQVNSEGKLGLTGSRFGYEHTPSLAVALEDHPHVRPFGWYKFASDRLYGLQIARAMFETIRNRNPVHVYVEDPAGSSPS